MGLQIEKNRTDDAVLTLTLTGRLDTSSAPELEAELDQLPDETKALILNLEGLEYLSSAGLRLLLKAQKARNGKGGLKLIHVSESVMEVLEMTGFTDFLTIEE